MTLSANPLVSIVTVTYNRRREVLDLLASLREQDYSPLEVIVVDNASSDGTADEIDQGFPEVSLIRNQENTGMVAYNTGMQLAKGKYVLFIDDDGLPATTDWVRRMAACFEENPKLGAIACQVRLVETGELAPDNPQHLHLEDASKGHASPGFVCTGAGVRASAIGATGGFPSYFFRSYMELTLSTKLWDAGWQVRYFPSLAVLHKKSLDAYRRARAFHYWALRNYYWYVWMLYPWPAILEETMHHVAHTYRSALQGEIAGRDWLRALVDAVRGLRLALKHRQPISKETLGWLHQLRGHDRPFFFSEVRSNRGWTNENEYQH